jgi:hypothetical protein
LLCNTPNFGLVQGWQAFTPAGLFLFAACRLKNCTVFEVGAEVVVF